MRKSRSNLPTCEIEREGTKRIFSSDFNEYIFTVDDKITRTLLNTKMRKLRWRSREERAFVRLVKAYNRQHIEVRNPGFRDTIREISDHVFGQRAHKAMGREVGSVGSGESEGCIPFTAGEGTRRALTTNWMLRNNASRTIS